MKNFKIIDLFYKVVIEEAVKSNKYEMACNISDMLGFYLLIVL